MIRPVEFDQLRVLDGLTVGYLDLDERFFKNWVPQYFPAWPQLGSIHHKKLLEFYATFLLSDPLPTSVIMDVAAGCRTYIPQVTCAGRYIQDLKICHELRISAAGQAQFIEGDAGQIDLPDESLDIMTGHHSFEHFRADSDTLFVGEVQRLLKPAGRCCIVPIFIADKYVEITNKFTFDLKFDSESHLLIDPTSAFPGGVRSGGYARVYSIESFSNRVLLPIDLRSFKASILELRMNGRPVPNLRKHYHSSAAAINYPYRALVIERL
jgi:SAM-dependent methyltransferase